MSKAGKESITGAEQALAYLKGDKTKGRAYKMRTRDIDVKTIRKKLRMTKAYLMVIDKNPSAVKKSSAERYTTMPES